MTLVLVTHGTRDPAGTLTAHRIAAAVAVALPGTRVVPAYADVGAPNLTDALTGLDAPAPLVVVPAFLAAGYHVRVDIPGQIERSGRRDVLVAPPLGPAPTLVTAVAQRLRQAGWRGSDHIVLAAAGSSDPRAVADVVRAADLLTAVTGRRVRVGFVATGRPRIADVVGELSASGPVAVASWLLAPGLFHRRLADCGAAVLGAPIGAHPLLVRHIVARYRTTRADQRPRLRSSSGHHACQPPPVLHANATSLRRDPSANASATCSVSTARP